MKHLRQAIFIGTMIFLFASCSSDTTDKGTGNNTHSGSYAAGNSDSTTIKDTVHPAQPNGMDTTAEQTGRMNNTASGKSQPRKDSNKVKK
jgi:hypothetical protein